MCCGGNSSDYDSDDDFWNASTANPKNARGHVSNALGLIPPDQRRRRGASAPVQRRRSNQPYWQEQHSLRHGPMFDDIQLQPLKPAHTRRRPASDHYGAGSSRRQGRYYGDSPLPYRKCNQDKKQGPPIAYFNKSGGGRANRHCDESKLPRTYRPSGSRSSRQDDDEWFF